MNPGVILNAYPDSLGGNLAETVRFLSLPALADSHTTISTGDCGDSAAWEVWENDAGVRTHGDYRQRDRH